MAQIAEICDEKQQQKQHSRQTEDEQDGSESNENEKVDDRIVTNPTDVTSTWGSMELKLSQHGSGKGDLPDSTKKCPLETLLISDSLTHKKSQFDEYLLIINRNPPPADLIVKCFAEIKFWKQTFLTKPNVQYIHLEETFVHHPKATVLFANLLMKSYRSSIVKLTLGVHRETSDLMLAYQLSNLLCLEVVFISRNTMSIVFKGCPRLRALRFSSYIKDHNQPLRPPDWSLTPESMMEINCLSSFNGLNGLLTSPAGRRLQVLGGISVTQFKLELDYDTVLSQFIACVEGSKPQEALDQIAHIVARSPSLEDLMVALETTETDTLDWSSLFRAFSSTGRNLGVMSLEQDQELPLTDEQIMKSTDLSSMLSLYLPTLRNLLWAFPVTFDGLAKLITLPDLTELTIPRFYPHPHRRFCCLMFYIDSFCRRDSFESFGISVDGNIPFPKGGFTKRLEDQLRSFCKDRGLRLTIKTEPFIVDKGNHIRHVIRTTSGKIVRFLKHLEISKTSDNLCGYLWKGRKCKKSDI